MTDTLNTSKQSLAIIGTGLIGCSMAAGLRGHFSEIIGVDNNSGHLEEALGRGLIDRVMTAEQAASSATLIILAVPVDVTVKLLPAILDKVKPDAVLADAGSIKGAVCKSVEGHPGRGKFVACHPMAGLALSGPAAADPGMFRNKKVIICEREKSLPEAAEKIIDLYSRLGMQAVDMEPDLHDRYVAVVSHLPQVMAYCLSGVTLDSGSDELMYNIASSGYESMTRLSSSPPEMWIPIFENNRANLAASVNQLISTLEKIKDMIGRDDSRGLDEFISKANNSRKQFMSVYK